MNQDSENFSQAVYEVFVAPLWLEISSGIVYLVTIILVIFIAHRLAIKRVIGGQVMLICVYLSVVTSLVPIALPLTDGTVTLRAYPIIGICELASLIFGFIAVVQLLRYVLSNTADK